MRTFEMCDAVEFTSFFDNRFHVRLWMQDTIMESKS